MMFEGSKSCVHVKFFFFLFNNMYVTGGKLRGPLGELPKFPST